MIHIFFFPIFFSLVFSHNPPVVLSKTPKRTETKKHSARILFRFLSLVFFVFSFFSCLPNRIEGFCWKILREFSRISYVSPFSLILISSSFYLGCFSPAFYLLYILYFCAFFFFSLSCFALFLSLLTFYFSYIFFVCFAFTSFCFTVISPAFLLFFLS